MKKYEVMYILRSNLDADQIKAEVANFTAVLTKKGAKVIESKEWGFRELAYDIKGNKKGYYVWNLVEADTEALNEFDRVAKISETLIRHIIVKDGE